MNYEKIAEEHRHYYGVGDRHLRIYRRLYADKTHFVYELIQNADDAGSPHLSLILREKELVVWNDGRPFNEEDVEGICSIGLSEKDFTQIGTFGIGFKAVYAYTELPEIYSGEHHFRIRRYVEPGNIEQISPKIRNWLEEGKTVFRLPFKADVDIEPIRERLERLGHHSLLFLRHLKKVMWRDERDGKEGTYSRSQSSHTKIAARYVKTFGEVWLAFHKKVTPPSKVIEEMLRTPDDEDRERIRSAAQSKQFIEVVFRLQDGQIIPSEACVLYAYLPTEKETHLRFLIQARYQTTPARDNIPIDSPWNIWLIQETERFLPDILQQIKTAGLLTPAFFDVLPIDADAVPSILQPIVTSLKRAVTAGEFIPNSFGGFSGPKRVFYPHAEPLRKILTAAHLADLTEVEGAAWLHPDIKSNSRGFSVVKEAGVQEINAGQLVSWLVQKEAEWFEHKDDAWLRNLCAYLNGLKAEQERISRIPLVRLESGKHVCIADQVVFFPPVEEEAAQGCKSLLRELPVLRGALLEEEQGKDVKSFFESLGVKPLEPADVIRGFILPQYLETEPPGRQSNMLHVRFLRDNMQKITWSDKIEICKHPLLRVQLQSGGKSRLIKPDKAYLPRVYTGESWLETYFKHSEHALFVNRDYCESDEEEAGDWLKFFKELGAEDVPRKVKNPIDPLSADAKRKLRSKPNITCEEGVIDWLLDGLEGAFKYLRNGSDNTLGTARALWELLLKVFTSKSDLGRDRFIWGEYKQFYQTVRTSTFEATFFRQLKETAWLPDEKGSLHRPAELFAPTDENQRLLGESVAYLHRSFGVSEKPKNESARWLAEKLGIHLNADTESVLLYLKSLSGSETVDLQTLTRIYRFLNQQGASRREAFEEHPLLLTLTPEPCWWRSREVFWEDESPVFGNLRGYLKTHYPGTLKPFFVGIGVSERAAPLDYVRAIRDIAAQNQVTEGTQERLHALYRRLWHAIQDGGEWMEDEEWRQFHEGKYWFGQQGDEVGFFSLTQLGAVP